MLVGLAKMKFHIALVLLLVVSIGVDCRPLDDDNPAQEGDDKRDKIDKQPQDTPKSDDDVKPVDDNASLTDSPLTDSSAAESKPLSDDPEKGDKREMTTDPPPETTPVTVPTTTPAVTKPEPKEGTTKNPEETTEDPKGSSTTETPEEATEDPKGSTTPEPVITTPAPEGEKPTVEGSDNNTLTMKGTTYHVAIEDKSVKFYEEMNKNMHDIHRHTFQTMIGSIYKDDPEYKQVVIIKFSNPAGSKEESKEEKKVAVRADTGASGVIVDMYLRFYNPGTNLKKLTEAIQKGSLASHKVNPLFVRAYVAEPTGRVCTPDCKVQCYSYCDAGCCHINIVQNVELPTPSPVEDFIAQQQQMLKTGVMPQKPCEGQACGQQQQAPMMAMMAPQMPCQGTGCSMPMMPPMMPPQMPCAQPPCGPAPSMMMMPPPQMGCAQPPCSPPPMMPSPQMPCQGASCAPPMQRPCQGPACAPPQMAMMPPPQMPCQGAPCSPQMPMIPPQMPCQGASCAPPAMPPQMGMCPPSCSQVCAPSCPNQCCGMQPPMMQQPPMFAPPARCGPKGC